MGPLHSNRLCGIGPALEMGPSLAIAVGRGCTARCPQQAQRPVVVIGGGLRGRLPGRVGERLVI
eukprot:5688960-Pyramimonas_sp.AAC.1